MAATSPKPRGRTQPTLELVTENVGGHPYEYYPLGEYIAAAKGVCGGRPTIKYRRLDARYIIGRLRAGDTARQIARNYKVPVAAVNEAIKLASVYDYQKSCA
jgi:uncharacterized protein (DUF433 family)